MTRRGWIVLIVAAVFGFLFLVGAGVGGWLLVKHMHRPTESSELATADTARVTTPVELGWKLDSAYDDVNHSLVQWVASKNASGTYDVTIFNDSSVHMTALDEAPLFTAADGQNCQVTASFDGGPATVYPAHILNGGHALLLLSSEELLPLLTEDATTLVVTFSTQAGVRTEAFDIRNCPVTIHHAPDPS